jgi:hypothetical protein
LVNSELGSKVENMRSVRERNPILCIGANLYMISDDTVRNFVNTLTPVSLQMEFEFEKKLMKMHKKCYIFRGENGQGRVLKGREIISYLQGGRG